jgi:glycosyltransferase involved in cell wall biosynthesis
MEGDMNDRPMIVVITPVRNEAWVLDAFLTCTSSWADRIIVADQHSTDGSREIAARYEKVVLVDNNSVEMNQAAVRKLLFQEVDKIVGDKIVFALDADEFLSNGFENTEGWNLILNSKPNEIFCFKWLNLYGDYSHIVPDAGYMEWGCHFTSGTSIAEAYERYENRAVHEMRVPCLPITDATYVQIPDIRFVHLARLNLIRQKNKEDFYQVSSVSKLRKRISAVTLYRGYNHPIRNLESLSKEVSLLSKGPAGEDARKLIKLNDIGRYYINEMTIIFKREGVEKFFKLDVWDNPYLKEMGVNPKIPLKYRLLHFYLRKTQAKSDDLIVKLVDKVLKHIY